ncbi:hypothetical protein C8R43DRAFT_868474 [Mycena crocata]|nr:hypothetical protein C8R43DRAFT_868474 [Mycena crocata]
MLSLGPGSACDVCLEPFGADLKAPCSILCGHVFCVNCLQHLARPTCPLCRTPFEARHTIRLHIDLDSIRAPSSTEEIPIPTNVEEGVRQFQKRITELAVGGATEAQSTQLINDCKAFLAPIPKNLYIDLRTSHKMLMYMCQVKRNFVQQGRTVHQLTLDADSLSLEVDRLKAAIEALKIEKRRLEQLWQNVCNDRDSLTSECNKLHAELDNAEARILLVTE